MERIVWTPLTIALQKILNAIPKGSYVSLAQIADQAGYSNPSKTGRGNVEKNPLFKKVLKEKNLKIVKNAGIKFDAKTYMPVEEFKEFFKANPKRDFELVESLKGRTTFNGGPWTKTVVSEARKKLNLKSQLYENLSRKAILADAPALMPEAFKQYQNKQLSYGDLKQKVVNKRQAIQVTPEQTEIIKAKNREKRKLWGPEKKEAARLAQKAARDQRAILMGAVPTPNYGSQFFKTDSVWFDLYRTALLNEKREIPKGSKTTIFKSAVPTQHSVPAVRGAVLIDTFTNKPLTYDNFVEFINKNKPGGKNFNEMVAEFEKKQFINQRPGLRASLNKLLHPEFDPYSGRTVPGEIHHTLGRTANAYDISFAPRSANKLEGSARKVFNSSWKNISKLKDTSKKFSMQRKALTDYVTKMEGVEGIAYGIKPGGKIRGAPLDFKPWITQLINATKDLTKKQKLDYCSMLAKGGLPGNCAQAIQTNPVKAAEIFSNSEATSGALSKLKNTSTRFLSLLGRGGVKAAPLAAIAAVGAAAEPLVKQFRNDDPSTYMTDIDQQKGVLLSLVEQETPKVDEEILKWQMPAHGAATLAGAIPGAKTLFQERRGVGSRGPLPTGVGKTRAALGISGVLGKALGASFSPLAVAATLPLSVAAQRSGGTDYGDIAMDPMNWMGPAFASAGSEMASKGIRNPLLLKALRLGMSPRTLMLGSRFLGLPGLALTAGMWGYDKWKNRSVNDED
jgi:hypothetical protein